MIFLLLIVPFILYPICRAIYNITYHPLAKYPGPKLWAAFTFPYVYHVIKGKLPSVVKILHDQYGPIVRVSPNELSFTSAQAWRDLYGARHPQNPKDMLTYIPPDEYTGHRFSMELDDAKHQAARSQVSHAFSTKALLEHQPLISDYIDQMISSIRTRIPAGNPLDVTAYFNWTTFDIIGHLTFGESFHCLDTNSYHPWIKVIFDGIAAGQIINQLARYGLLEVFMKMIPKSLQKPREDMVAYSNERMQARLNQGFGPGTRRDFAYFMRNGPEKKDTTTKSETSLEEIRPMDRITMCANAETLVIAGSETTATLLSGVTFLLLTKRPEYLEKIKKEVRTAFPTSDDLSELNFKTATERLPYMIAALREALRVYPPAPFGFARNIAQSCATRVIDGEPLPSGTSVSISQWAANHSARNFHRPDEFLPERWFDDVLTSSESPFRNDQRDACQPFSFGPRGCLGKTLADMESRLMYARLIWNFDFEIVPGQDAWIESQRQSLIYGKGELMIRFKERVRE